MSLFNVPQFIDIEDKIVGPLTAKQLGWAALGSVILIIAWFVLDFSAFILAVIVVGLPVGALAFYRPNGQPFTVLLLSAFTFFLKPKIYIWKRIPDTARASAKPNAKKDVTIGMHSKKEASSKKLHDIAQLLDSKNKS